MSRRVGVAGLAARVFHDESVGPVLSVDGQLVAAPGGSATRWLSRIQALCQGQSWGRCRVSRRAEVAIRQGIWISVRRTVAVVARARSDACVGAARVAAARVRLNAITARTSQAALAVNTPDGRCASAEFFRSAWTCSMIA